MTFWAALSSVLPMKPSSAPRRSRRSHALPLLALALLAGCKGKEGDAPATDAGPSVTASSSSSVSSAALPAPAGTAKIGKALLADFKLSDSAEVTNLVKPLGFSPIMGCGQGGKSDPGASRAVTCTYGEKVVNVRIERKLVPKKKGEGFELGPYTYARAALASIDGAHVLVTADGSGSATKDDAEAALKALVDPKAKTIAGTKLAEIDTGKKLATALETQGFTDGGYRSDLTVAFSLRKVSVDTHSNMSGTPENTSFSETPKTWINVKVSDRAGKTDPATEKKILDTLLGR